jgi:D-alanyl-D-alanine carboxypeptidase
MKNALSFILCTALLLSSSCKTQQISKSERLSPTFTSILGQELSAEMPGTLAAVWVPKQGIKWYGAAGLNEVSSQTHLAVNHQFRIASVTKTFVAAAILRLWEDQKLSLDDPIEKYISTEHAAILRRGAYDPAKITIRHLLHHSSGLFDHTHTSTYMPAVVGNPSHQWTRTEQLEELVKGGKPVGQIGEKFSYSDTGYILLGEVVEKLTQKTLNKAIQDLLNFPKLGLKKTWFEGAEPQRSENRIHQYMDGMDTYQISPSVDYYGGGGLLSTSEDLARFFYNLFHHRIFKQKTTLDTMLSAVQYASKPRMDYRMGIFKMNVQDLEVYTHTGFWGTQVAYVPSLDASIALNYSQIWKAPGGMAPALAKILEVLINEQGK